MNYIDFHCDTLSRLHHNPEENFFENHGHIDLKRLLEAGALAQFFACFTDTGLPSVSSKGHYNDVLEMAHILKEALTHSPKAALAKNYQDYLHNRENGLLSCFLTVEEGGILGNDMKRLYTLYETGIRLITLTWNYENCIGSPHNMSQDPSAGLKPFGLEVLEEMERLKMLIDVSHLSDPGFYDVLSHTSRPFIASHSCCRTLCGHSRNLTDDMIRQIGQRQGLVGLNFYGAFLSDDQNSTVDAIIQHLKHLINVGGIDIAAIGTDFDGMDGPLEISGCQDMPLLFHALESSGFHPSEIDAICYKNAERVLALL